MDPSTMLSILIALLCLALLVYLPRLRNAVLWICFPFVMVFVRYPKTRKPGLGIACLGIAIGGVLFGIRLYRERAYWYCDRWRNKDGSLNIGRTGDTGMVCFRGLKACRAAHENPAHNSIYDVFNDWAIYEGDTCGHSYKTIWNYDYSIRIAGRDNNPEIESNEREAFLTKEECEGARQENVKLAKSPCYRDETKSQ